ncbi:hypothetical protein [Methylobacterium nigriterrae]|uniref:hypothetical protein n=1 Tax=Methylobacterium nigriterrae TaxID=3127512 RepID=UPI003013C6AE
MKGKVNLWRVCADGTCAKPPFIYFIQSEKFVKIGWTMGPPERRALMAQTYNPHQCFLMGAIAGGADDELWWHTTFEDLHVRGEWFRLTDKLRSTILFALKRGVEINRPRPLKKARVQRVRELRRERLTALDAGSVTADPVVFHDGDASDQILLSSGRDLE